MFKLINLGLSKGSFRRKRLPSLINKGVKHAWVRIALEQMTLGSPHDAPFPTKLGVNMIICHLVARIVAEPENPKKYLFLEFNSIFSGGPSHKLYILSVFVNYFNVQAFFFFCGWMERQQEQKGKCVKVRFQCYRSGFAIQFFGILYFKGATMVLSDGFSYNNNLIIKKFILNKNIYTVHGIMV